ncbi:Hypothetical protein NTJ_09258 [Nesidiocoris tenuis]|uniref:Uncharacterized protein n=1 Tax=Nesidiocoris tenuis TaxID=355587 RepID=A0ABN7AW90_9HEMI|nr:Hypothetical protein NTJ_09258 [Nesidiocoris tenuis]
MGQDGGEVEQKKRRVGFLQVPKPSKERYSNHLQREILLRIQLHTGGKRKLQIPKNLLSLSASHKSLTLPQAKYPRRFHRKSRRNKDNIPLIGNGCARHDFLDQRGFGGFSV